ncbi:MAG TPA: hypothetical protein VGI81_22470 [Tepidisphaeraceae bacterium]
MVSVALVVAVLWAWQGAQDVVLDHWVANRPDLAEWAVRIAAIAAIALAQMMLAAFVAGRVYRRGILDSVLTVTAGIVFALASIGAVACGLAAR